MERSGMTKPTAQKWHDARRLQFSYVNGLFLGFSTGATGIVFELLRDDSFSPGIWGKRFVLATCLMLGSSIFFGLQCAYNRLIDFREMSNIALKHAISPNSDLARMQSLNRMRGEMTWKALHAQIATFLLGSFALILTVASAYSSKIF
jgi:hypothetical protein